MSSPNNDPNSLQSLACDSCFSWAGGQGGRPATNSGQWQPTWPQRVCLNFQALTTYGDKNS
eukprot:1570570-Amphidinium_carterae.1